MRLPLTLTLYIGRRFLQYVGIVTVPVAGVAWLVDSVEISRRAASREAMTFENALEMATYKLPHVMEDLIPFIVLLAAMITFFRLTRDSELPVIRAAGISIWQFALPVIVIALLIGALRVTAFNPISAALYTRYDQLSGIFFHGRPNTIALSSTGLWIRQADAGTTSIVHARRVVTDELELSGVTVFNFAGDRFISRIDAPTGRLEPGAWILDRPTVFSPDGMARRMGEIRIPTTLTTERIQGTLSSPETVSFWDLPAFIRLLESSGFRTIRHVFHWHRLVASPFLLVAIVLVAATFSLRLPRRGGAAIILGIGIGVGFAIFLVSNIVAAFGRGGIVPPALAAWAPPVIWSLLATASLLHLEDG
ncbi:MAG: LPS export ABC transporter permease LptG [Alphaproteobacteria bacterium]|nr:LPS export ABC transporter permease LptG [Alphaproteobacteria bacterium]